MSDFYSEREVTAAKPWTCAEAGKSACRRTASIAPRTRYVRCFGVMDGEPFVRRLCLRCARLYGKVHARYMKHVHPDDGPTFGSLRWWVREARR